MEKAVNAIVVAIKNIVQKIKRFVRRIVFKIKRHSAQESCYKNREYLGHAAMGNCSGIWGGDYYSEYLEYSCVACSHYTKIK